MTPDDLNLFSKLAEYGAVGILAGALYLIARLYHPAFVELSQAVKALPTSLKLLAGAVGGVQAQLKAMGGAIDEHREEILSGLHEVHAELAVIKDRLPRDVAATVPQAASAPAPLTDAEQRILDVIRQRKTASAAGD